MNAADINKRILSFSRDQTLFPVHEIWWRFGKVSLRLDYKVTSRNPSLNPGYLHYNKRMHATIRNQSQLETRLKQHLYIFNWNAFFQFTSKKWLKRTQQLHNIMTDLPCIEKKNTDWDYSQFFVPVFLLFSPCICSDLICKGIKSISNLQ